MRERKRERKRKRERELGSVIVQEEREVRDLRQLLRFRICLARLGQKAREDPCFILAGARPVIVTSLVAPYWSQFLTAGVSEAEGSPSHAAAIQASVTPQAADSEVTSVASLCRAGPLPLDALRLAGRE